MKVRLLNAGGFGGLEQVLFPVEVEAEPHYLGKGAVKVWGYELYRVGASGGFRPNHEYTFHAKEIEVIK